MLLLGIVSFDANDPSINYVKSGAQEARNKAGLFGAYAAGLLNDFFGIGALLWPAVFAVLGAAYISTSLHLAWWRWCGFFLLTLCLLTAASSLDLGIGDLSGGGVVGATLLANSIRFLSPPGSFLIWLFILLAGLQLAINFSWITLWDKTRARAKSLAAWLGDRNAGQFKERYKNLGESARKAGQALAPLGAAFQKLAAKFASKPGPELIQPASSRRIGEYPAPELARPPQVFEAEPVAEETFIIEPCPPREISAAPQENPRAVSGAEAPRADEAGAPSASAARRAKRGGAYILPEPDLLQPAAPARAASPKELEAKGQALMACFNDFDVQGELARITPGPVVTMFEVRPAPGIRVSRIANLCDDLSLALKAVAVRIQAPIPGTDTVGIEIPNDNREIVNFRELVESRAFGGASGALTMILGKDIAGKPFMADLAKMPHMLVAGATGAGKSVCLNSILISLLYRMPPDRLKLLLIDPKRIEMAVYADLPHLVHPVVTEMEDATNALAWAVAEMENRFKIFMRLGVRNIAAYHDKLVSFGGKPPENLADLEPLPYMVIVIDELADLMLTAAREVEGKIQRLAQLARAAGIHMILATQRPSVDVVTGLIKAQFPCRVSFQVSSRHDSRTILDEMGAEHLLGRGDMLFKPPGSRLLRLHGPFLSDEEVQVVVEHWKAQETPDYQVDFSSWGNEASAREPGPGGDASSDALYSEARTFVLEQPRPSISLLQRHLRIGYNRAARLMEQFKREGIVTASEVGRAPVKQEAR